LTIKRYGTGETGAGKQALPFARAVEANGWLHVSGQIAMENGEVVGGGIVAQTRKAIENLIAILHEAGYGVEDVVRVGSTTRVISGVSMVSMPNTSARIHRPALACNRG
jgi:enamine deaminase RidA (YjgF/YER057c/UK114 family)